MPGNKPKTLSRKETEFLLKKRTRNGSATYAAVEHEHTEYDEVATPEDYNAVGNGTTDDTSAVASAIHSGKLVFLPNKDYYTPGSITGFTHPTLILADNASESGTKLPFVTVTIPTNNFKNIPQVHAFFLQDTTYRSDSRTVDIRRWVNTNDGHTNPHALHVETIKYASNAQTEWAISGVLYSYNTTADNGSTAVSGSAFKMVDGGAGIFAGHFQARDDFKAATSSTVTGCIGAEINCMGVGDDHPTANQIGTTGRYNGNRWGHVYIPITNTSVSGWNTDLGDNFGEYTAGAAIRIQNDSPSRSNATWLNGIVITDITGNPNPIDHGIVINTSGGRSIWITGNVTGTHLQIQGNATNGLVLSGTYSGSAIRIPATEYLSWENTAAIKTTYGATANLLGFYNSATERFGINMSTGALRVNGLEVVGPRNVGWVAMTGTANENTVYDTATVTLAQLAGRVMALQAALTTHGLIGV